MANKVSEDSQDSHRGGFGELGGEERGLIDRSFRERIILIGLIYGERTESSSLQELEELSQLVDTAGADVVQTVVQRRSSPDPATFIGQGKAREVYELAEALDVDTVVFNEELTPAQQFNLEKIFKRSALDRTAVILDIFAQNASTPEGKAQVELAQLQYRLPRLKGQGGQFSQQAGGIGTRGPGETKLEIDRRRLVRRVHKLQDQLTTVGAHRKNQSKRRRHSLNQSVAIVGYTNAGKSTLLNSLANAGAMVADRLFATLDPLTRRLQLPGGESIFLTDTVGFVKKLPHQLVEAFKTTLDVVIDADLLLHIVDSGHPSPETQINAVRAVLSEIGADQIPEMLVFNKSDKLDPSQLLMEYPESVAISAVTGVGVDKLVTEIGERLRSIWNVVELSIPFDKGDILAQVHREGQVLVEHATEDAIVVQARLDSSAMSRLSSFIVSASGSDVI
ncbi:MAG: GTPase HflX [Acidimicrobiales bacterium]|nr:GTPase HflX [Acidimicrobiales bacterium]MDG1846766.1 GTPase HflX [Acidimicrobiales bacterium]